MIHHIIVEGIVPIALADRIIISTRQQRPLFETRLKLHNGSLQAESNYYIIQNQRLYLSRRRQPIFGARCSFGR